MTFWNNNEVLISIHYMYDYIFNYSLENFSLKPDSIPPYNNFMVIASPSVSFVKI